MVLNRQYSLRLTITSILIGLVLLGTLGVVGVALLVRRASVAATVAALAEEASRGVSATTRDRLAGAEGVLDEFRTAAGLGLLPVGDPSALARWFASRLRGDPRFESLAWLAAGAKAGAGAMHLPDGKLLVLWGTEIAGEASPVHAEVWAADGSRRPSERRVQTLAAFQDVDWYSVGAQAERPAWTERFRRPLDGSFGRACAVSFRRGGALVGVFEVGIGESFVAAALDKVVVGRTGGLLLLDPMTGKMRNAPTGEGKARLIAVARAAVTSLPAGIAGLRNGETVVRSVSVGRTSWTVAFALRDLGGPMRWVDAVAVPSAELVGYLDRYLWIALSAIALVILLSLLIGTLAASRISRPLRAIAEDLRRIGSFELSETEPVRSIVREIATLSDDTSRMKKSLRSFGRYVPTALVRELLSKGEEARLGGRTRRLTLFFSDVEGFTAASEGQPPQTVVEALGDYLAVVTRTLTAGGGTVDKYMGDGVLAFFNAPHDDPVHPQRAARAALEVQAALLQAREAWGKAGRPLFRTRIGLHTAEVVVGNIGTPERFAYTVIGDGVNLAARLESLNKAYGTLILASRATREEAGSGFVWRRLDRAAVVGRTSGDDVFELLGAEGEVEPQVLAARDIYERALDDYLARRFGEAAEGFDEAAALRPDDGAARALASRSRQYLAASPPPDWTGVHTHSQK
jgi:adenylate cyclase